LPICRPSTYDGTYEITKASGRQSSFRVAKAWTPESRATKARFIASKTTIRCSGRSTPNSVSKHSDNSVNEGCCATSRFRSNLSIASVALSSMSLAIPCAILGACSTRQVPLNATSPLAAARTAPSSSSMILNADLSSCFRILGAPSCAARTPV
jgi:hypothetical protein